jgi:DNA-binding response OmpR family regulator
MRLMLVEDDVALRRFLEAVLGASHEVSSHASGTPALAALAPTAPDLLISDLMLPDVPGEEIARTARRLERAPAILLMSGDRGRLERARSLADATLAKPFSVEQLERVVETLAMGKRRGGDRRRS